MNLIRLNAKENKMTLRKVDNTFNLQAVGRRGIQGPKGDPGDVVNAPVQSVNGKQGNVVLNSSDVGADSLGSASAALIEAKTYTDSEIDDLSNVAQSGDYNDLLNKPNLSLKADKSYVDSQDDLKVDKVAGKELSSNDYTNAEKTKLSGIQAGAEVNVNADWNATAGDAQILNKPTIPTVNYPVTSVNGRTGDVTGLAEKIELDMAENELFQDIQDGLITKQDILISGSNIKTVNGNSVLGSGDINISTTSPDASASTKGLIRLSGGLSGTAMSPSLVNVYKIHNVKDYGAVADGITDDTASIQSSVNAALSSGGTVYIPSGTYAISGSITIVLNGKSLIIKGDGDGTILKSLANSASHSSDIINVTGAGNIGTDRIVIRDLQVVGSSVSSMGIRLNLCYQGELTNIRAHNFSRGSGWGVGVSLNQSIDFNINNLVTTGCSYAGLQLENASNANHIIGGWLYSGGTGLRISDANGNTFVGTVFETNSEMGVRLSGGRITRFYGCWIENNTSTGILSNELGTVVDGCWFTLNGTLDYDALPTSNSHKILNNRFNDGGKIRLQAGATNMSFDNNENITSFTDAGSTTSSLRTPSRVGINRTNPSEALDVNGKILSNNFVMGSRLAAGTTNPQLPTHSNGPDGAQILASTSNGNVGGTSGIEFRYSSGGNTNRVAQILGSTQSGGGGDILFLTAANGAAAYLTQMTLARSGMLGVGNNITPHSTIHSGGSFASTTTTVTTATTLNASHSTLRSNLSTALTHTLPTAVGIAGRIYTIKNINTGVVTIATTLSQTIDGATTYSLATQYKYVTVQSNGVSWDIIGNN